MDDLPFYVYMKTFGTAVEQRKIDIYLNMGV